MLSFTKFILTHIFHVFKYIKNENNNFIKGLYKVQFKQQIMPGKNQMKNPFLYL